MEKSYETFPEEILLRSFELSKKIVEIVLEDSPEEIDKKAFTIIFSAMSSAFCRLIDDCFQRKIDKIAFVKTVADSLVRRFEEGKK